MPQVRAHLQFVANELYFFAALANRSIEGKTKRLPSLREPSSRVEAIPLGMATGIRPRQDTTTALVCPSTQAVAD